MDTVSQIKQKLDVVDVIGSYIPLKKAGRNYKSTCPFHSEKTPSFMVSPELQIFKCFGCGEAGDIFNFVQKIEGVEFSDALEQLAEKAGVKLDRESYDPKSKQKKQIYFINDLTARFYHKILTSHKLGKDALKYLKEDRNLTSKTIKSFLIGYSPRSWDTLYKFIKSKKISDEDMLLAGVIVRGKKGFMDKFRGRIVFPLMSVDGKVIGFTGRTMFSVNPKYLNTPETLVFHKNIFLYGLDKARIEIKKEGAVFVEGQMDVITANQSGLLNVVAASGTSLTEGQLNVLARYTKDLTFCFDPDPAGYKAMHRAVDLAEKRDFDIKLAIIPDEYEDLDDLIRKDKDKATQIIRDSVAAYDFYIISALKRFDKNTPTGKKKIMEDLAPKFASVRNKVLIDHYSKEIAGELDLSIETVLEIFSDSKSAKEPDISTDMLKTADQKEVAKYSPEFYVISLLLKADLDILTEFAYKLEAEDFSNDKLKNIFEALIIHVNSDEEVDITTFAQNLEEHLKETFSDIYLWDPGPILEKENLFRKELQKTIDRIKNTRIKENLKIISESIKLAEKENNKEELDKLTKEFEELSKKLV